MNIVLILIGFALCVSLYLIRTLGRTGKFFGVGLAILAVGLCGVYWFQAHEQAEQGFTSRYQMSTGYALGKVLARELPEGGRVLVWQMKGKDVGLERMRRGQVEGLRQGAGRVRFKLVPVDPDRHSPERIMAYLSQPTLFEQAFFDELALQSEFDAVVSFIGLPTMANEDLDRVHPPVFAVDSGHVPGRTSSLNHSQVKALVIPRRPKIRAPQNADLDEVFHARYLLITPEEETP